MLGGVPRRHRRHQRCRCGRRRVCRQQHGPRRRNARRLSGCHRRRRAAPCGHQGGLFRSRARDQHQRAGRQLRQHRGRHAMPVPDPYDVERRRHRTGRRRRRRLDLHRQLQRVTRHELFGAARIGHGSADAVGAAVADPRRDRSDPPQHRAHLSSCCATAAAMRRTAARGSPTGRPARMRMHDGDLWCGNARRRCCRARCESRRATELHGPVLELTGGLGVGLGHQLRASGRRDLRHVVHLRPDRQSVVARR